MTNNNPLNIKNPDRALTRQAFLKEGMAALLNQVTHLSGLSLLTQTQPIAKPIAVIEVTACTAYQGSGCQVCYEVCPIQDTAIRLVENLPEVIPANCTACNICVEACPTPGAIMLQC